MHMDIEVIPSNRTTDTNGLDTRLDKDILALEGQLFLVPGRGFFRGIIPEDLWPEAVKEFIVFKNRLQLAESI